MTEGPQNPYQPGNPPGGQSGYPGQQPGQPSVPGQPPTYRPTQQLPGYGPAQPGGPVAVAPNRAPSRPGVGALTAIGVAIALVASLLSVTGAYLVWGGDSSKASSPVSNSAPAPKGSVQEVAQTVLPSVVSIDNRAATSESSGSGVVISADGKIVTNNHVIAGNGALTVTFSDGSTSSADLVGADPVTDLAVIRVRKGGLKPITFGDSGKLAVGQDVVAVGAPLGLAGTVTSGIVSALNRPVATSGRDSDQATVVNSVQTDAAINPGNSGGALVDMQGQLVGVNSAIASLGSSRAGGQQSGSIGLGFAIPSDLVKRITNELITTGQATHAAVGVQVSPGQTSAAEPGAVIGAVSPTGAFGRAGIPEGSRVTKIDSLQISDGIGLMGAVRSYSPGATVTITYVAPGSSSAATKQVTLDKLDR
ncbi:Peptidase S1 and S6 chymotrypsin/Hap OS=Tsukamurella paurometabola (strain ATCC 8368 / DSM /CCUG 35730 / CIP 100753 / JCM 10117 / KCTC 9821 / NBRC 16120/ NCIMB 702349 / NCTC 13040) OX=521096 GN=Tpau_3284 PE=3 SV=1 [Tsukamurella paurometabola]|uniref:Peptidase S1 and S6 chymotrypsin/Hap n=1 Tax=Tsukamurella paurometabola (strain ATCC 8368 / DSM 20162 / CCUG 35730 / CIP 100753 / JCM 10117 / KCTC 9821 / NBRC 16120 / NCIMB 702349 / NCTC 13040) TaxID=521096 RepID=D5UVT7_TSUPD|nr:trypsin-like peptidase domain-containing protein [Tsukamurella paurometabola]ADG79869.1 peptidase S1 and S6 chymotrypsin/Hap [Tsukamurella paurometabola DSM 20162]SUP37478.1 Periplasmic serine endoprotease DegP precursor [Tsukamurella paurometabola]